MLQNNGRPPKICFPHFFTKVGLKRQYVSIRKRVHKFRDLSVSLSGNTFRVRYHLCIRHTVGTVFVLHQSLETCIAFFIS